MLNLFSVVLGSVLMFTATALAARAHSEYADLFWFLFTFVVGANLHAKGLRDA